MRFWLRGAGEARPDAGLRFEAVRGGPAAAGIEVDPQQDGMRANAQLRVDGKVLTREDPAGAVCEGDVERATGPELQFELADAVAVGT
eukprot:413022-Prymnesium_polylepis.1